MSNKLFAISGYDNSDPNGYSQASYPQGVENPFVPAVIPYPSNLHGSQWTYVRDGHAFKPAVYNVLGAVPSAGPPPPSQGNAMNYGAKVLLGTQAGRAQYRGGNAAPDANTQGGVFGNQSRGGGIFSQGMGEYFTASEGAPTRAVGEYFAPDQNARGLGATDFNHPWGQYSDDTLSLQRTLNGTLPRMGLCTIEADGKLGPATCGAAKVVNPEWVPGTCQGSRAPSKCGAPFTPEPEDPDKPIPTQPTGPAPAPTPAPTTPPLAHKAPTSMFAGKGLLIAGIAAVGIGAFMVARKRGRGRR